VRGAAPEPRPAVSSPFPDRRAGLRSVDDLVAAGLVTAAAAEALRPVGERYAVALTPTVAGLIDPTDPADPIARQFVPAAAELVARPAERADPIGDDAHSPVPGIVHRYPDRVLLKLVSVCAVYCRFCFRRETVGPGGETALGEAALARALDYVAATPTVWEVVVTGGDPFVVAPRRLKDLVGRLGRIPHVKIVRFHTRVPVVAPERIDAALVEALQGAGVTPYVVVHANHPRELAGAAAAALGRLAGAGVPLLGQSVLLRGVNDDAATLAALFRRLVELRVKPYYLHHPDLAPGTGHFRLDIAEGRRLVAALRGSLSGIAQPTYVLDIPGGYGKVPVGPGYAEPDGDGWRVTDVCGAVHRYDPDAGGAPGAPPVGSGDG